jgi:hypothetical protein
MQHVVKGNKDGFKVADKIDAQPMVGKFVLCVLVVFAQVDVKETSVGELKSSVAECLQECKLDDEMVTSDDFLIVVESLVDSGLLCASIGSKGVRQRSMAEMYKQRIRLEIQLEEVAKSLDSQLNQACFQRLRDCAKKHRDILSPPS